MLVCSGFRAVGKEGEGIGASRTPVGDTMARYRIPAIRDVALTGHVRVEDGITEAGRA